MSEAGDVIKSIVGGVATSLIGNLISGGGGNQQQPPVTMTIPPPIAAPVTPMPTPDDKQQMDIMRQSIAEQRRRQGRASTILTDQTDALGG